jgi:hypothetical protein
LGVISLEISVTSGHGTVVVNGTADAGRRGTEPDRA